MSASVMPRLAEVQSLFGRALEMAPGDRAKFLDQACADDTVLRAEVEELLQAHSAAGNFLEKPATDAVPDWPDVIGASGDHGSGLTGESAEEPDPLEFLIRSDDPQFLGRLDHYAVTEVIGRGGMGIVLKALDENLHRTVAIKVVAPQLAVSATARKRFIREAQAAAAVRDDHIVTIHAVDAAERLPHFVMEYISGVSLQERIDRDGPLETKEILRIGMQTARGLAAAHAQGLIHRDIKPANILLENGVERVKITDFGLARAVDDGSLTHSGIVAGTPQYMAPEQARGEPVDHRADLFSLGSVLYAMCTGGPPFRAETVMATLRRVSEHEPPRIRQINPEIPDWLVRIVARLHAKRPEDRFSSAAEVAALLEQHLAHWQQPDVVPAPSLPKPTRRRTPWHFAADVLILLALTGGVLEVAGVTQVARTALLSITGVALETAPVARRAGETSADDRRSAPKAVATAAGSVDLLRLIVPKQHAVEGDWRFIGETLVSPATGRWDRVEIPYEPPEEYDLAITAERKQGSDMLSLALVSGAHQFFVGLDMFNGRLSGLGLIDGKDAFANETTRERPIFGDARPHKIVCHVSRDGVAVTVDSETLFDWRGSLDCLTRPKGGEDPPLGLTVTHSTYHIYDVVLTPHPNSESAAVERQTTAFTDTDAQAATTPGAFALLTGEGVERTYDSLAEAMRASNPGDTIEVRTNGPLITEPLVVEHPLTLRAAKDVWPVLKLSPIQDETAPILLTARAALVLEGLEFQRTGPRMNRASQTLIQSLEKLSMANCRLLAAANRDCLWTKGPIIIRNSELHATFPHSSSAVGWDIASSGQSEFENCVITGGIYARYAGNVLQTPPSSLLIRRTTTIAFDALRFDIEKLPPRSQAMRPVARVETAASVFDTRRSILQFNQVGLPQAVAVTEATALLQRLLVWREEKNAYRLGSGGLTLCIDYNILAPATDLSEWDMFWGMSDTGSIQGTPRFQGEYKDGAFVPEPESPDVEELTPEQFRLHPDSVGYRAGPDGKDLGPDIDFVGPGEAYERWKQTPDYRQWLEDTRRMLAGSATERHVVQDPPTDAATDD